MSEFPPYSLGGYRAEQCTQERLLEKVLAWPSRNTSLPVAVPSGGHRAPSPGSWYRTWPVLTAIDENPHPPTLAAFPLRDASILAVLSSHNIHPLFLAFLRLAPRYRLPARSLRRFLFLSSISFLDGRPCFPIRSGGVPRYCREATRLRQRTPQYS